MTPFYALLQIRGRCTPGKRGLAIRRVCSYLAAMRFTKMHGLGNDYIYIDCFSQSVENPVELARRLSDRHFGIGGDGLILILPSDQADVRMRMFNADGSESQMCGNGVRCVAKYAWDHQLATSNPLRVETGRGILDIQIFTGADGRCEKARVNMGRPILQWDQIPADAAHMRRIDVYSAQIEIAGEQPLTATLVSMGNPHAVISVPLVDASKRPVQLRLGELLENHPAFPQRINVHFVQWLGRRQARVLHWERGSGATLACGTGACAVLVAGVLGGLCDHTLTAHLPGGAIELQWDGADAPVFMTGPAVEVFSGRLEL